MPEWLDNWFDHCLDQAPYSGHLIGEVTGAAAAAPFVAMAGASFEAPPAAAGFAAGAVMAHEGGKEIGTTLGTAASTLGCHIDYQIGNAAVNAYQAIHDYFSTPEPGPATPHIDDGFASAIQGRDFADLASYASASPVAGSAFDAVASGSMTAHDASPGETSGSHDGGGTSSHDSGGAGQHDSGGTAAGGGIG